MLSHLDQGYISVLNVPRSKCPPSALPGVLGHAALAPEPILGPHGSQIFVIIGETKSA